MPTLYVTEPGSVVRRRTGSFIVTCNKEENQSISEPSKKKSIRLEVEPHRLEMIGLVGRVHITAEATRMCLDNDIAVSWLSRNGKLRGRLVPELSRTADLRLLQYQTINNVTGTLKLCKAIIDAKLANAASLISMIRSNRPKEPRFSHAIAHLGRLREKVSEINDLQILLGCEGEGAAQYFSVLGLAFSGDITFETRRRRPPPDPANALLSLGYVLLANLIAGMLEARGFDPYMGVFHKQRSGRPSLALDIMEEFRHPVVDRFVLRLCNRRQLKSDDFETNQRHTGTRLKRNSLKQFFREWEKFLDNKMANLDSDLTVEEALHRQINRFADYLRGRDLYQPLLLREADE
ncbi:MAG: CRISPR-associated endonuclease Cas1 [Aestuariivita sp.]|nr:CRISPR-associated endonuclease Cas1 [Aestuariivita sp.]